MILVDTSVWIDFFRGQKSAIPLGEQLEKHQVVLHPWVWGELAVGNLGRARSQILDDLNCLAPLSVHPLSSLREFIDTESLWAKGLSLIDVQLLYSSLLEGCQIWTRDQALRSQALRYGVDYQD